MNPARRIRLAELAAILEARVTGDGSVELSDACQDSRLVAPGSLFIARQGEHSDGAQFIPQAIERGAVALLSGAGVANHGLPTIEVADVAACIGPAAEAVHGYPSRALSLIGITGTNGKTTTAHLVHESLRALGQSSARLGTLGYADENGELPGGLTTPEADVVSRLLARARDAGARRFVMEVSSHALALGRVEALDFAVAAFSNLTQDHLDFHSSLEEYAEAKARLFLQHEPKRVVLNLDDAFGPELQRRVLQQGLAKVDAIGVSKQAEADVVMRGLQQHAHGMRLDVDVRGRRLKLSTQLVGQHNVDNWLLTLGVLLALDVDLEQLPDAVAQVSSAPGRLERCELDSDDISVLVDYAHTPDALERALQATRSLTSGRLICVFGCGGDRDPAKRAPMGEAAARYADYSIITNDNPRTEDPQRIAEAVERGVTAHTDQYEMCLDRAQAIRRAIALASPGDCVLLAGKGHEDYQIIGTQKRPFDDREQAKAALAERRG